MQATARQIMVVAAIGSAAVLGGAFAFQLSGYPPCALCILQRWPHALAIVIGLVAWTSNRAWPAGTRILAWTGAAVMLACAGLAFYHTGIELKWWHGATACAGGTAAIGQLSVEELMKQIEAAPVVRCDEPAVLIFGLSMAAWNAICSLALALVWLVAARRAR